MLSLWLALRFVSPERCSHLWRPKSQRRRRRRRRTLKSRGSVYENDGARRIAFIDPALSFQSDRGAAAKQKRTQKVQGKGALGGESLRRPAPPGEIRFATIPLPLFSSDFAPRFAARAECSRPDFQSPRLHLARSCGATPRHRRRHPAH